MSARNLMMMPSGYGGSGKAVDDVFSVYNYTGSGSSQTINNGIDLSGNAGMVWCKPRSGAWSHALFDTLRGTNYVKTDSSAPQVAGPAEITGFTTSGFNLGAGNTLTNQSGIPMATWTFRKSPGFFDIITYTGDGTSDRVIPHSLGSTPGMVTVKATSATGDWVTWHRGLSGNNNLLMNSSAAAVDTGAPSRVFADTTNIYVHKYGAPWAENTLGVTYVVYLWAHDVAPGGLIQCGSFTTDLSGNATINLGWEPQFIIKKPVTAGNWQLTDIMRGLNVHQEDLALFPNTSQADVNGFNYAVNGNGFTVSGAPTNTLHIYVAIRRSNKAPTTGTQVFTPISTVKSNSTSTVTGVGFSPDLVIAKVLNATLESRTCDRLRGSSWKMSTGDATTETSTTHFVSIDPDGVTMGAAFNLASYSLLMFKRAAGFFDSVCYRGSGASTTVQHALGVVPELVIVKARDFGLPWAVYSSSVGPSKYMVLNAIDTPVTDGTVWNSTTPTANNFSIGTSTNTNTSGAQYVAYLFASLPGISKVGSYTGNGASLTISCGFSTGARLIMIKRTDSAGDWFIWDTARGILAAQDPHWSLNTTAPEVGTDDTVDPVISGFIVNQNTATNVNISSATYIFFAIA